MYSSLHCSNFSVTHAFIFRVVEVTAVFLGLEVVEVIAAVKVGGNKVIKAR